ncbi:MAG: hypothetical protein QN229_05615 [Desulfurococcaceae archaeon TW002]
MVFRRPKIMIKLEIHIPPVNAELCRVIVRRLPSLYRPTKTGFSEEVYSGTHRPGETITAKQLLTAIVAKTRIEGGEYKVEYYEPAEYFVVVACIRGNKTEFKYVRTHEVYPNKLITTHRVETTYRVEVSFKEQTDKISVEEESYETTPLPCNLERINPLPGAADAAECITWVKGPYLYSLPGLKTAFRLVGGVPPSGIYLSIYSDYCGPVCYRNRPQWSGSGRKLVFSSVTRETPKLSGRWKDRVYFNVRYVYEEWHIASDGFAGISETIWLLYPTNVRAVSRSGILSQALPNIPNEQQYLSLVPPAPSYATGPLMENEIVWFTPVSESDVVLASITIGFSYVFGGWSAGLTVSFYKAGRNDSLYTTPYVSVEDVSRNTRPWYYWWYTNNDPMTYQVQFSFYR